MIAESMTIESDAAGAIIAPDAAWNRYLDALRMDKSATYAQGSITRMPQPRNPAVSRVAMSAPQDSAIAAIIASRGPIESPARRRVIITVGYTSAAA